jgi:hypothetical protein
VFFIPCLCFVLCTKFKKKKKDVKKKKKVRETSQKKNKKEGIFYYPFPFDVGDDSRTNPFEERGNDENQQASLNDPLLVD